MVDLGVSGHCAGAAGYQHKRCRRLAARCPQSETALDVGIHAGEMGRVMIIRNARVNAQDPVDIAVKDGRIAAIGANLPTEDRDVIDARGMLALPPFVETHIHLDKILWGLPWTPNCSGPTLKDMIENEKRIRRTLDVSVEQRAGNLIRQCVAMGSAFIRSHVDIDPDYGLSNLHGVMAARERHRHAVDIEIVAFPQVGVLRRPGTAELMDAAVAEGAAVVGGL